MFLQSAWFHAVSKPETAVPNRVLDTSLATAAMKPYEVLKASSSSFAWPLRLISVDRRDAAHALYAFCRVVDDIADGPGDSEARLAALQWWREELSRVYDGTPRTAVAQALATAARAHDLPRRAFEDLLDGMESDAREVWQHPTISEVETYCWRAAGTVGLLLLAILDVRGENAQRLAETLGLAVQLTNILRDRDEDVANGRIYIPVGVDASDGGAGLTARAYEVYKSSDALIAELDRAAARPIRFIHAVYRRLLNRLDRPNGVRPRADLKLLLSASAETFWKTR